MRQNENAARRPRGRPQIRSDDETRDLLVEAATEEFQANGYAATCMGTVAQRAGISTKTLYRLIPTKAELFTTQFGSIEGLKVRAQWDPQISKALTYMPQAQALEDRLKTNTKTTVAQR